MPLRDYLRMLRRNKQSAVNRYLLRIRVWEYRQNTAIHKISGPTYLDKARMLGYKRKPGIVVYRVRVKRGGRPRKANNGNTHGKPSKSGIYQRKPRKNLQGLAEIRLGRRLGGLRLLNSYWVGQDRVYKFFEAIMVDPHRAEIRNDSDLNWICKAGMKHRECRGLTAATKRSRGLGKGIRYNQTIGGSRHACWRRRNTLSLRRFR